MSRAQWLLLTAAACAALTGCAPLDALPYAYEIEDTVLLRTLGVDTVSYTHLTLPTTERV